ncbi:MAG: T9SS type A sorting domain-containing protein [Candidatus Tenebribacter burtonii]|nr:T9SS type A sorting domain-containing protein [Candidatus Tenebribacter burtonii]
MKKILLVVIIQVLGFSFLFSQTAPDSLWFNIYSGDLSEKAHSLIQTSDDNFVFTGRSYEDGNTNVYLVKTNEDGIVLWSRTYDRSNWDFGYSVCETSDAGLIITGQTRSNSLENADIYLIRTDAEGDTLWTKSFDSNLNEFGRSVIQTVDGGFMVTGFGQTPDSGNKMILLKTDENGNILWNCHIGGEFGSSGKSILQTSDGGFIITGHNGTGGGSADLYLIKTNTYGDTLWTKGFQETGIDVACYGNDVKQTNDNGFIIAGEVEYNVDDSNIYLIKTDENGNKLWSKTFGDYLDCGAESVQETNDGGYIISGWKHEIGSGHTDIYILKTNSLGDSLWSKSFGGAINDIAYDLVEDSEGNFIVTGYTDSYPLPGNCSAFLLKLGYETGTNKILNSSDFSTTNYPNPFNPTTTIEFSIQNFSVVELSIFNIKGQIIKTLINESLNIGDYSVTWNGVDEYGNSVSSGIYLYKLNVNDKTEAVKKCLLLK